MNLVKRAAYFFGIAMVIVSCNTDHKKETISNYVHYIWKRPPGEIIFDKVENVKAITAKDSIDILIHEYAKSINPLPSFDTVLVHLEKDIDYNSQLLAKTNLRIDSLTSFQKKAKSTDDFLNTYIKTFTDLRDFTVQQIDELKYYRSSLKRYSKDENDVLSYVVLCQYKLKGHSQDTTSKVVTQTFFLSPDTRKIFMVK